MLEDENRKLKKLLAESMLDNSALRDRPNRVFDAYMLDLSQYAGERARRNFEIVEFWTANADDSLRKTKLIFAEHQGRTTSS